MPLNQEQATAISNSVYQSILGEAYNKIAQLNIQLAATQYRLKEVEEELKRCQNLTPEKDEKITKGFGES